MIKDIEGIKGKSKKNYQNEFDYLIYSGIALNVDAIANPVFPLIQSQDKNLIKLYLSDVGLLSNIYYKNNIRAILDDNISMNLGTLNVKLVAAYNNLSYSITWNLGTNGETWHQTMLYSLHIHIAKN